MNEAIDLNRANPCYVDGDGNWINEPQVTYEWAMGDSSDTSCDLPADPPDETCTISGATSARPSVECSEAGTYPIRLRLEDAWFPSLGPYDDCAVITVPEPGALLSLASGLALLAWLQRRRQARA